MPSEADHIIGAASLLAAFGEEAPMHATMRAFSALSSGDRAGYDFWQGVLAVLGAEDTEVRH
jgi:hypothetical protein